MYILIFLPAGGNHARILYVFENTHMHYVTLGVWGVLTFMLTCCTCACYVTPGVWCVCVFTFMLTCRTCACYVTPGFAMWRLSKLAIPCSLATRVNSQVNPKLMRSIRVWQWHWMNSKENLLEKTGRTLQKRMPMWKKEKSREFSRVNSL